MINENVKRKKKLHQNGSEVFQLVKPFFPYQISSRSSVELKKRQSDSFANEIRFDTADSKLLQAECFILLVI